MEMIAYGSCGGGSAVQPIDTDREQAPSHTAPNRVSIPGYATALASCSKPSQAKIDTADGMLGESSA
jgi:hypothetical protein